jgi:hypothetical protein
MVMIFPGSIPEIVIRAFLGSLTGGVEGGATHAEIAPWLY